MECYIIPIYPLFAQPSFTRNYSECNASDGCPMLLASLTFINAFSAISYSAPNLLILPVGQFLCEIP
jgi:hypothetical protein